MVIDTQLTLYTLYGVIGLLLLLLNHIWIKRVYWETKYEESLNSSHTARSYEYMRGLNRGMDMTNEYLIARIQQLEEVSEPLDKEDEEETERGRW